MKYLIYNHPDIKEDLERSSWYKKGIENDISSILLLNNLKREKSYEKRSFATWFYFCYYVETVVAFHSVNSM